MTIFAAAFANSGRMSHSAVTFAPGTSSSSGTIPPPRLPSPITPNLGFATPSNGTPIIDRPRRSGAGASSGPATPAACATPVPPAAIPRPTPATAAFRNIALRETPDCSLIARSPIYGA